MMNAGPKGVVSESKEPLGEILLKRKCINKDQLREALKLQKEKGRQLLGEILIELEYLDEKDIVVALMLQFGLPYIAISKYEIPPKVLRLVPRELAEQFHVIPLDKVGDVASIVMADPLDESVKEQLRKVTRCRVVPFIATKNEIDEAVARRYDDLR